MTTNKEKSSGIQTFHNSAIIIYYIYAVCQEITELVAAGHLVAHTQLQILFVLPKFWFLERH